MVFRPVTTVIKRVEGDVNKLCEDLDQFLFQRFGRATFPCPQFHLLQNFELFLYIFWPFYVLNGTS